MKIVKIVISNVSNKSDATIRDLLNRKIIFVADTQRVKNKIEGNLYEPNVYQNLIDRFGWDNVFILSAGWGLVKAN